MFLYPPSTFNVDAIFEQRQLPFAASVRKKKKNVKKYLTGVWLKRKVAGRSLHKIRFNSGIVNAAGGQDGLDGARLIGLVLDVHDHSEWLADVDAFELDKIELHVLLARRWQRVEPLRHLGAAHRPVQGQSLNFGA